MTVLKHKKTRRKRIKPKKNLRKRRETPVVVREENDYVVIKPIEEKKVKIQEGMKQKLLQLKKIRVKPEEKPKKEPKIEEISKMVKEKITKSEKIGVKFEEKKELEKIPNLEEARKTMREKLTKIPINMIETDIDKLMVIIEEKKSVNVKDLSKALNVKVERIENWAKILEEHGLIEIEYPIIGLPRLRKKNGRKNPR